MRKPHTIISARTPYHTYFSPFRITTIRPPPPPSAASHQLFHTTTSHSTHLLWFLHSGSVHRLHPPVHTIYTSRIHPTVYSFPLQPFIWNSDGSGGFPALRACVVVAYAPADALAPSLVFRHAPVPHLGFAALHSRSHLRQPFPAVFSRADSVFLHRLVPA